LAGSRPSQKIRYLSTEQAEKLHNWILDLTGGERGDLSRSNLEYLLEAVKNVGERLETRQAIIKKTAFLLYNLVVQHPFVNGNKRTAFELVKTFLEINRYRIRASKTEVFTLLSRLASGHVSLSQAENWIATNLAQSD